jgi:hypothetical protein
MNDSVFDDLRTTLAADGPAAAIGCLCSALKEQKDYPNLFYALLLKKRHDLGVSPIPTGPAAELPAEIHQPYEEGIRAAAREVGNLYLADGNIPHAWAYFRMIGENEPVRDALERANPATDDEIQPLIDIAYHQGVHPRKGFDWILDRYGICNAITTVSSQEVGLPEDVREHCLRRLVRALHEELVGRLRAAVENREGKPATENGVDELIAAHPWLSEDEFPHIDTSHLSTVVQMSVHLQSREELALAQVLCRYGASLSQPFQPQNESPFDDFYRDYAVYLSALAGDDPDPVVEHFRAKVTNDENTRPAEVLVNLLLRLNRVTDALAVSREFLANADSRQLVCPDVIALCQRAGDFEALASVARRQGDPVHYLAGLLAREKTQGEPGT